MTLKNGNLYKKIFIITLPIVIQNLMDSAVNMADVVMLDYVGQNAMSAVSLANYVTSVFFMFLFGLGTGVTLLGAQYWGKGDLSSVEKAEGIALRYTSIVSLTGTALCLACPEILMRIFTNDTVLIELGSTYLKIGSAAIIMWGISAVYLSTLRSIGRVTVCTVMEAVALASNVILNALFIFVFGMGVEGVAVATVLSRVIELLGCIIISAGSRDVKIRIRPIFEKHRLLEKDFISICIPAICNDMVWGLAFSMYTVILGHLSSDAVAANAIVNVVRNFGCVLCYGLGSATCIILGQILGAGEREKALKTARIMLKLSVAAGALGGIMIAFTRTPIVRYSNLTDAAREYLSFMLLVNVFYIMGTAVNQTIITGVFRAGGDTKFGFLCDAIDMWCWGVPIGLLAAFVFKLDVKWVYILMCTDEFVKWPWVFKHFYDGKWARNITRDNTD